MLQLEELCLNFLPAQRIVVARPIEVDDVTLVRFFKNRIRRTQCLLPNRREFHVTVIACR